jgi:PST family polysaccharide transporter
LKLEHLKEVRSFCTNMLGFSFVNYVLSNADRILVGRLLGAQALGLYGFAFYLTMFPVRTITTILISVLVPSLSRLQDEDGKFREKYVRACAGIALVTFPMMLGVASVAGPLVSSVWGQEWIAAIPLIILLTPVALVDSIAKTTAPLFIAKGRTDLMFRCALVFGAITVSALFLGARWGVEGVASASAATALVLVFFRLYIPFRLVSLRVRTLLRSLMPYLAASLLMSATVMATRTWVLYRVEDSRLVLAASALVGAAFYGAWMAWTRPDSLNDLRAVLVRRRGR